MTTVKEAITQGTQTLKGSVTSPGRIARLLLAHILQIEALELFKNDDKVLSKEELETYNAFLSRAKKQEPFTKIIGEREFYGRTFITNHHVLDPRPDSETLIEACLEAYPDKSTPITFLELGIGSGCLALTLLKEYPNAKAVGVDISFDALTVAQQNAINLDIDSRVTLLHSDMFDEVEGVYDVILSNPPYIPEDDMRALEKTVTEFDPHLALVGKDTDGLGYYRDISKHFQNFLSKNGHLLLEVGAGQAPHVSEYFESSYTVEIKTDLNNIQRILIISSP